MKRLVVIGGGISGLAAAQAAREAAGEGLDVVVLERAPDVGGKALSLRERGFLVEAGPTGYLDNEPAVDRLVAAAGLTKIPADGAAAHRFIYRAGKMREVKANPLAFAFSGLLSPRGLLRIPFEIFVAPRRAAGEESVFDFARRRIGRQGAERLIAPMMLGVFAGDARRLSLEAALPRMAEIERTYGSLFKGLAAIRRAGKKNAGPAPSATLTSFPEGLQQLPRELARRGRFTVRCGVEAERLVPRAEGGYEVVLAAGGSLAADAVALCGEPWATAALCREWLPDLARPFSEIHCPPVAVVALGYGPAALDVVPRGFGVLVPRGEGVRTLGALWDTHLFAGRSPERRLLLRAMLGGAVDPEAPEMCDAGLVEQAREDLEKVMKLSLAPVFSKVVVWPRAIPQYELGHLSKVRTIEAELARRPGLFVGGNGLYGIAFAKAAAAGIRAGEAAASYLRA